jgi:MurNAc alpha-1-phosphate uridylyltransferase
MSWKPDSAMVLGAGLGTRMQPLTDRLPKPLVQLRRKALIDHVLDRIADAGICRAVVNLHYKADLLEAHLQSRRAPTIILSDERRQLLDTGGGVKQALGALGPGAFLVHNSDSVWIEGVGSNLDRLFAAWDEARMDCLLMLALGSASIGYMGRGDFSLDAEGRIRRRREGEVVPFVYTGVQIVHPRLFERAPAGAFSLNLLWNHAMLVGRAHGVRMEGLWMHVGSPGELAEAERVMAGDRADRP